jgi:hypothetical protein
VQPGVNGEVVPIRDAAAVAEGVLKCWARVQSGAALDVADLRRRLSFATFETDFFAQLTRLKLI